MNLPLVAAEVTRRTFVEHNTFRLLTSAATVQGFNARNIFRGNVLPSNGERVSEGRVRGWPEFKP